MDNEREALARVLYEGAFPSRSFYQLPHDVQTQYRHEADRALAAGWRKVNDTPKREWPVTPEAVEAYAKAPLGRYPEETEFLFGLRAAAPFLWRARVEQLTDDELTKAAYGLAGSPCPSNNDLRAALLALGDL